MEPDAAEQYATTRKLAARGLLHDKYAPTSWFDWMATRLPLLPNDRVLDVGCGPAWFWRSALHRLPEGLHLTLTDASQTMIDAARPVNGIPDHVASLTVQLAEAEALPYANDEFDAVIAMHMLYHVKEPRLALKEMHRVLRPGGRVVVTTNMPDNFIELGEIGAAVFGGEALDPAAMLFSLDDAGRLLAEFFTDIERDDLEDVYRITDPDDVIAFLTSMPPGDRADAAKVEELSALLRERVDKGAALRATRRSGMVRTRKRT